MKKILIITNVIFPYRSDFLKLLKSELLKYDVELSVVYGEDINANSRNKYDSEISWAKYIPNRSLKIGNAELIWQPCLKEIKNKDLVIVGNANKYLINYYLMFARKFSKYRLAYWDHGRNLQADINSWQNKFKYLFIKKCDWWFGYTNLTKRFLVSRGYPLNKITIVQNAIDTVGIRKDYCEINETEIFDLKKQLGINNGFTAIFCGAMYSEKKIDFILEACYRVKKEIPNFHMIFMGSGIEADKVIEAAESNDWIHYVGAQFGINRVKYFKISQIQLIPYYVGLGIVDSFALETPLITTSSPFHGPEIEYLENGINGFMTNDDIHDYSTKVAEILKNGSYLHLIDGCKLSAETLTIEAMVENFKEGVLSCLSLSKK